MLTESEGENVDHQEHQQDRAAQDQRRPAGSAGQRRRTARNIIPAARETHRHARSSRCRHLDERLYLFLLHMPHGRTLCMDLSFVHALSMPCAHASWTDSFAWISFRVSHRWGLQPFTALTVSFFLNLFVA